MNYYKNKSANNTYFTILIEHEDKLEYRIFEKGIMDAHVITKEPQLLIQFADSKKIQPFGEFLEIKEEEFNEMKQLINNL